MYIGLITHTPMPYEYQVWSMAERFGWSLEYIESLPLSRWHELIQIDDGRGHAERSIVK